MNTIHLQLINDCKENLSSLENMSPMVKQKTRIAELDQKISDPNLWNDPNNAGLIMKERAKIFEAVSYLTQSKDHVEYYEELIHSGTDLNDKEAADLFKINSQLSLLVFQSMMSDPIDKNAAILSINSGAGGLEACDFSSMLLRMYSRYCAANGFDVEIVDIKEADGGYIDSVTLMITGDYAYGYLKNETGTMRLVRNSPFNSDNARHTSFSAIRVLPNIDETIDIKIEEKDLEIYGQIGGGGPKAGGQARNKTASACRIKHFPSGISFVICTERSFHTNRKTALTLLKAKLYDLEFKKRTDATDELNNSLTDIAFGSQIRSFILSPYSLVKDHRTKYERSDTEAVLNGDIHGFMLSSLKSNANK